MKGSYTGPLFTKRTDALPQDPVNSRDSGLDFSNRSNRHIGMPVKFQRDMNINEYYNIQSLSFEASWSLASG